MSSELLAAPGRPVVAYFSMEIALESSMPTYAGGLGILAGDTLRAAADLRVPVVGISLLYHKGYFRQHLDAAGRQSESPSVWRPEDCLELLDPKVTVEIEGRKVEVRAWRYLIKGTTGFSVPVYFLDTRLPHNDTYDQTLTDALYLGDDRYRLCQEAVLGVGGPAILHLLGHENVRTYHMNEGHSAFLSLALLEKVVVGGDISKATDADRDQVRSRCVFTTHTPVPAGHDQFPEHLVRQVLGDRRAAALAEEDCFDNGKLNMTLVALSFSRFVNGVAMRHRQISRDMFPGYPIASITNGVHATSWTSQPFQELLDKFIPQWRAQNFNLRYAVGIPREAILQAHKQAKGELLALIEERTQLHLNPTAFTIGFARRAAPYKRADLIFTDLDRLRRIVRNVGPIQIVYAGKAHPRDEWGKSIIARVFEASRALETELPVVFLEDYDMELGKRLCTGVDLWLNTPQKPQEASGTSGMKAALNGIPSLSVLDGWWVEGHAEGVTGWSVGSTWHRDSDASDEAASLYEKLEHIIVPMYFNRPMAFAEVMRAAIALNGSFFNAQRMVLQYVENAYEL